MAMKDDIEAIEHQALLPISGVMSEAAWGIVCSHLLPADPPFAPYGDLKKAAVFGDPTGGKALPDSETTFVPDPKWARESLTQLSVPAWFCNSGVVPVHRAAASQLSALLSAWSRAGLSDRIVSFNGTVAYRRMRGSKSISSHAYGIAFDVNARENTLGQRPAMFWEHGCLLELVKIANEHGWFWGGHFRSRKDGMHFELGCV
jgi:hypothetical protein